MEAFKRFADQLEKLVLTVSVICFAIMTFCGGAQVFSRYVFNMSLDWTEEIARFMFIFSTLLGSAICVRKMSHINMDLFLVRATPEIQRLMEIFVVGTSVLLFAVMTWYGMSVSFATMEQVAPATDVSMGLVYLSVPLSGLLMILFSVENLVYLINKKPEAKLLGGAE